MTEPKRRPPPLRRRLETTVSDPVLTNTLADRVKREVALENASDVDTTDDDAQAPVVVVLGPDGVPQIADAVDDAPETIRVDLEDAIAKTRT